MYVYSRIALYIFKKYYMGDHAKSHHNSKTTNVTELNTTNNDFYLRMEWKINVVGIMKYMNSHYGRSSL